MSLFMRCLFVLLFISIGSLSRSQFPLNSISDSITILSSASQIIFLTSNKLITDITLTPVKFKNQNNGFKCQFSTKGPYKQTGLMADSFLMKSKNNEMLLNHFKEDTVYYNKMGGLDYEFISILSTTQLSFLQTNTIDSFIFFINGKQEEIKILNKSKNKLKDFFKEI